MRKQLMFCALVMPLLITAWSPYWCIGYFPDEQVELKAGWNLISFTGTGTKNSLFVLYGEHYYEWNEVVGSLVVDYVYLWDNINQRYLLCNDFDAYHGYWLFSYFDCYLVF